MTPMTAGGICELLFEKDNGLVPRHNAACEEEGKRTGKPENGEEVGNAPRMKMRKLRQAQFGIGGSNPQNVGGLVRVMQRPLFVDAPRSADGLEQLFPSITKEYLSIFPCRPSAASPARLRGFSAAAWIGQWGVRYARANRFESAGGRGSPSGEHRGRCPAAG